MQGFSNDSEQARRSDGKNQKAYALSAPTDVRMALHSRGDMPGGVIGLATLSTADVGGGVLTGDTHAQWSALASGDRFELLSGAQRGVQRPALRGL